VDIRSFLAFDLPSTWKEKMAHISRGQEASSLDVRWVKSQNIHLTLVFLGTVPSERIDDLSLAVQGACKGYAPFSLHLQGMGLFPGKGSPRVLWIGLEGDIERMGAFRNDVQNRLKPFGILQEKRPYRPHLTLGRFRKSGRRNRLLHDFLSKNGDVASKSVVFDTLYLYKSDLRREGPIYTRLASWPLTGS
jgi:2'-5' RNA ligase